jgi:1,4-alpha-glucan branching enzyme
VLGPHAFGTGNDRARVRAGARRLRVLDADGKPNLPLPSRSATALFEALVATHAAALPAAHRRMRAGRARSMIRTASDRCSANSTCGCSPKERTSSSSASLGAHPDTIDGVRGTRFAVWAPNARRVSVVGDWNRWDGRVHPMRLRREAGVWELFIPGVEPGARYKYELLGPRGKLLPLRADPVAFRSEVRPATPRSSPRRARYVWPTPTGWKRAARAAPRRADADLRSASRLVARVPEEGDRFLTYRELAEQLVPYVARARLHAHRAAADHRAPLRLSWGYQTTGWFAPTSRFGEPDDFRAFVDAAHAAGLGVILDWVPGHFPTDAHALGNFDGTPLYEHADPREGFHREWGTYVFNLGRTEVANFLLASALYWLREFHLDGLRVDAVASLLYRDYSRKPGEWVPNAYGGRENLEAVAFLRRLNTTSTARCRRDRDLRRRVDRVARRHRAGHDVGGLGFGYKWNMGWMHDTLKFIERDPLWRGHHLGEISFGLIYAFSENFVLPLSHDEVVHGKRSLLGRMPGDDREQFANVRLLYAHMWAHPGKKLLFAGGEFAQRGEWRAQASLDWHVVHGAHAGVQTLVKDCQPPRARHPGAARARLRTVRLRVDLVRRRAQRRHRVHPLGRRARRPRRLRGELQRRAARRLPGRRAAQRDLPRGAQHRRRGVRRLRRG